MEKCGVFVFNWFRTQNRVHSESRQFHWDTPVRETVNYSVVYVQVKEQGSISTHCCSKICRRPIISNIIYGEFTKTATLQPSEWPSSPNKVRTWSACTNPAQVIFPIYVCALHWKVLCRNEMKQLYHCVCLTIQYEH